MTERVDRERERKTAEPHNTGLLMTHPRRAWSSAAEGFSLLPLLLITSAYFKVPSPLKSGACRQQETSPDPHPTVPHSGLDHRLWPTSKTKEQTNSYINGWCLDVFSSSNLACLDQSPKKFRCKDRQTGAGKPLCREMVNLHPGGRGP